MAGDQRDDEAEDRGLQQRVEHVPAVPEHARPVKERLAAQADGELGREHAGQDAREVRHAHEHGGDDDPGQQAGRGQRGHGVAAEGIEGVDLLRDLHRPDLGGDARSDAANQDEGRHHRPQLQHHARGHHAAQDVEGYGARELIAALLSRHHPRQDARDDGQGQALDADLMRLGDDGAERHPARNRRPRDVPDQQAHLAHVARHGGARAHEGTDQAG